MSKSSFFTLDQSDSKTVTTKKKKKNEDSLVDLFKLATIRLTSESVEGRALENGEAR